MVQKCPNLLVLEEAGTETVSPVLRAYGLVCATRGTKFRSRSEKGNCLSILFYTTQLSRT